MHRRFLVRSVLLGTLALWPLAASAADFGVGSGAVPGAAGAAEALAAEGEASVSSQKSSRALSAPDSAAFTIAYYRSWLAPDANNPAVIWGKASTRVTRRVSLILARNFLCIENSCTSWYGTKRYNYYGKVWAGHWHSDGYYHNYYSQGAHKVVYQGVRYTQTTAVSGYL